ncbi:Protein W02A2.5, partial [Aphelenchoides avenae]
MPEARSLALTNATGRKLRVAFADIPPHAYECQGRFPVMEPTTRCPNSGWCVEILTYLADALHLEIEPLVMRDFVEWGEYVNGSWTGSLNFILNDTIDTMCLLYQSTPKRRQHFGFTHPVFF